MAPQIVALWTLAQLRAAEEADGYVQSIVDLLNLRAPREGQLAPRALAGDAADGRPLETLVFQPLLTTKAALDTGLSRTQALRLGENQLQLITSTEVTDAGRVADGVAIASRPGISGYVRMLTPPSCPRCAILAGRFYRWNAGFERHPQCDCIHIPVTEDIAGDARTDPRKAVLAGEVTGLSKADEQAIRDGADPAQVVNAHRGMFTAGGKKFTREGTTRRALARQRLGPRVPRLRPESIYRQANGNREEALRLLRLHGYIV